MPHPGPQSYASHRELVPWYHFIAFALLLLNFGYAGWMTFKAFSFGQVVSLLTAVLLAILYTYLRVFPLGVQDRVIRLEERLRYARLFPDDLKSRIEELTPRQCVGLRFAADGEVAGLARRVLDEGITNSEAIKKLVKEWRPDHARI